MHIIMSRSREQQTDLIPTIKKPDYTDAMGIIAAQKENPNRQIVCTFHAGNENEHTATRIPSRHFRNGMIKEIMELFKDMQRADFAQVMDVSER